MAMFEDLFDLRTTGLKRDLVGMEEVKTRLKRKGEELEELKKIAADKKRRAYIESNKRASSRISIGSPNIHHSRRQTMRSQRRLTKGVTFNTEKTSMNNKTRSTNVG